MNPSSFRGIAVFGALLWLGLAVPAQAQTQAGYAWVWADMPAISGL